MLWKKESDSGALYIDYFAKLEQTITDLDVIAAKSKPPVKSNRISDRLREEGNVEFEARNWANAIMAYNYALRFAKPQSVALAHAYANRSACYFELDRYNSSLIDTKFALNVAVNLDALRQQLKQNHSDCLDFISPNDDRNDSSGGIDDQTTLSPTAPNDGEIQWLTSELCEPFRYRFTANSDVDVGQTIWTETALVSTLMNDQYMHCNVCFAKSDNLIPCSSCTTAMFCNQTCQSSYLHMAECNSNTEINEDGKLKLLIRSVLHAIQLFNSVDDLMEFVMQTISGESQSNSQHFGTDCLSEYRQFLQLKSREDIATGDHPDPLIYFAFKAIINTKNGEMFEEVQQQRFLTHLIWQHQAIISLGYVHQHTNKFNEVQSLGIFPQFSHFKHSCTPNAMYYLTGRKLVMVSLTPIRKGEEIYVSYFGKTAMLTFDSNAETRKELLRSLYKTLGQKCNCSLCHKSESNPAQRKSMKNDRKYRHISRIYYSSEGGLYKLGKSLTTKQMSDAREHAIAFLRKYGRRTWCKELAKIAACFMDIIWLESETDDDDGVNDTTAYDESNN